MIRKIKGILYKTINLQRHSSHSNWTTKNEQTILFSSSKLKKNVKLIITQTRWKEQIIYKQPLLLSYLYIQWGFSYDSNPNRIWENFLDRLLPDSRFRLDGGQKHTDVRFLPKMCTFKCWWNHYPLWLKLRVNSLYNRRGFLVIKRVSGWHNVFFLWINNNGE